MLKQVKKKQSVIFVTYLDFLKCCITKKRFGYILRNKLFAVRLIAVFRKSDLSLQLAAILLDPVFPLGCLLAIHQLGDLKQEVNCRNRRPTD